MNYIISIQKIKLLQFLFLALVVALSGCTVKSVSSYDENTDKSVTKLQKDFEKFFVKVDSQVGLSECTHDNHVNFYQDATIAISVIEVRARAIAKNKITIQQVELLKDSLFSLEKLHKLGCFTTDSVKSVRSNFNTSITAILKLELAKKRGK